MKAKNYDNQPKLKRYWLVIRCHKTICVNIPQKFKNTMQSSWNQLNGTKRLKKSKIYKAATANECAIQSITACIT